MCRFTCAPNFLLAAGWAMILAAGDDALRPPPFAAFGAGLPRNFGFMAVLQ